MLCIQVYHQFQGSKAHLKKNNQTNSRFPLVWWAKPYYFVVISELGLQPQVLMTIGHSMLKASGLRNFCESTCTGALAQIHHPKVTLKRNPSKLKQIQSQKIYIQPSSTGLETSNCRARCEFFFLAGARRGRVSRFWRTSPGISQAFGKAGLLPTTGQGLGWFPNPIRSIIVYRVGKKQQEMDCKESWWFVMFVVPWKVSLL